MSKFFCFISSLLILASLAAPLFAQPAAAPLREIFVPFEDLPVILENDKERVFLTRQEYEDLLAVVQAKAAKQAPVSVVHLSATYQGKIDDGRARITGALEFEVLNEGWHMVPLPLSGVGVQSAKLDGQPATLGRPPRGPVQLFVQGIGKHRLELHLTAAVPAAAALQTLQLTLPTSAASTFELSVAGNVEIKAGASVVSRQYDEMANRTNLKLLLAPGPMSIVMSLNNKQAREQRLVVARTIQVAEITLGYERLHVNVAHRILHDPVDRFRFVVPAGFEVTNVTSQRLSRWEVKPDDKGRQILEAILSEATTEPTLVAISANRSPELGQDWLASLRGWKLPRLQPLDVAGEVAVVGLLVENRLQTQELTTRQLLPIDSAILTQAMPESIFRAEPGAPIINHVATFYVPAYIDATNYDLSANFVRPEPGLIAATSLLLALSDQGHELRGGFVVSPLAEDLFQVRLRAPLGWRVTEVLGDNNQPLPVELYEMPDGSTRMIVTLASRIPAGSRGKISVRAVSNPPGWLGEWKQQSVTFPELRIEGATRESGAIAVQTSDDLAVQPVELTGLVPLLENEKAALGLAGLETAAAYRFETRPIAAKFTIERGEPSVAAEVFSFLQVLPDAVNAHYELIYQVREARTRQLEFSLPVTTPKEITIRGLDGAAVKEYRSADAGDRRHWTVQLADRQVGEIRLTVDFRQPVTEAQWKGLALPLIQAESVEFQSAFAWLEGSPELEVQATAAPRAVDEAELYQARYLLEQGTGSVDRRVIGAYGYQGTSGTLKVDVVRRAQHALPAAIVQRAELLTRVSANGVTQSVARYDLVTKATLLEVSLPGDALLWTMLVDGQPTKPQKEGDALLVSLPPRDNLAVRRVQVVYETSGAPLNLSTTVDAFAPKLLLRGAADEAGREVPQADLQWQLILPSGYQLRSSGGTVAPVAKPPRPLALWKVADLVYDWGGGIGRRSQFLPVNARLDYYPSVASTSKAPSGGETLEMLAESATKSEGNFEPTPQADFSNMAPGQPAPPMSLPQRPFFPAPATPSLTPPMAEEPKPNEAPASQPPVPQPTVPPQAANPPVDMPANAPGTTPLAGIDLTTSGYAAAQFAALEGVSSLPIDFTPPAGSTTETFRSLGVNPHLQATLVDTTRVRYAALGVGLLVFLMGMALTHRPARQQAAYVVIFLLASSLPVLLTSALDEIAPVFDAAFFAACALIPYFLFASVWMSLWRRLVGTVAMVEAPRDPSSPTSGAGPAGTSPAGTVVTLLLLFASLAIAAAPAHAVEPVPAGAKLVDLKELLPLLDPGGPLTVPGDAVIVPYDPELEDGPAQAKKVLIPYARFQELWKRAHPEQDKTAKPAPVEFAVVAAQYEATLAASDELLVTGKLSVEILSEKPVAIPLPFSGGVLVKATLGGQPARLQIVEPKAAPNAAPVELSGQQAMKAPAPPAGGAVMVLHAQGAGRKEVELTFRLGLTRRGGWRQVAAALPLGGANRLTLRVPEAGTEVRLAGTADKDSFDTKEANETIETTLTGTASGRLDLQWRPKVAVGQIDQSLTAKSVGVLDVREDALRLTWQTELNFGRGTRDQFEFLLPQNYAIEQVLSANLRGWQVKPDAARQVVSVTLLKPATGSEKITLILSRRGRIGTGDLASFDAPAVFVSGAALQQGELMVRRSPRLELRTETVTGLVRADSDASLAAAVQAADSEDPSILNLRPYQVYRFVTSGMGDTFQLRLQASEATVSTTAEVRTILRVADRETTLESSILFRPQGQPLYQAQVLLPAGFELDQLLPAEVQWSVVPDAASGRNKLSVQLLDGREGEFTLTLLGRLAARAKWEEVAAPVVSVLGVQQQQGEVVVLSDPDTDVQATNVQNAEVGQLQRIDRWLKAEQRPLARVVLTYRAPDYSALFQLTRKTPRVTVRTVSNLKVTRRAIEETLLLEYTITNAGIHELKFLLPESLKSARIRIPQEPSLLQRKKVEPAVVNGQPVPGWVQVTLSLQDDVADRLGVIVEHDRLLTDQPQSVAIPRSLTGETSQRLVVIENAGRDEVVEVQRTGLEPLSRQQQAWQDVVQLLGEAWSSGQHVTQAYVGVGDSQPTLTVKTKQNQQLETAKARIEFARTTMVVDEAGGYRAVVAFQVNNRTEQYLDLVLPAEARLWTAKVKGQPVKPVEHSPQVASEMRIPLVKTPAGSGDYSVEITYGGSLGKLSSLRQIQFPLIRTRGINVEQSQVQLFLPEGYEWPYFGGTMKQVSSEVELEEGFQAYFSRKVSEARQALQSDDLNTQLRAQANLSGLMQTWHFNSSSRASNNLKQSGLALNNYSDLQSAQQDAEAQVQMQLEGLDIADNRGRLNETWEKQKVIRSKNVVTQLGNNFDDPAQLLQERAPGEGQQSGELAYNPQFLKGNKLDTLEQNLKAVEEDKIRADKAPQSGKPGGKGAPAAKPQTEPAFQGRVTRGLGNAQVQGQDGAQELKKELKDLNDLQQRQSAVPGDQSGGGRMSADRYGRGPSRGGGHGAGQPNQGMGQGRGRGEGEDFRAPGRRDTYGNDSLRDRDNANRYQQKLQQEQAAQTFQLPNQAGPSTSATPGGQPMIRQYDELVQGRPAGPMGAMGGIGGGFGAGLGATPPSSGIAEAPAGLASLDIQIPARGQVFMFTTPRGAIEITAQPVARDLVRRLTHLGMVLGMIVVGIIAYRIFRQLPLRQATGTMAFAILVALLGFLSLLARFLPWIGLVLLMVGVVLIVRRLLDRRPPVVVHTETAL
jgi:hypothetical protein